MTTRRRNEEMNSDLLVAGSPKVAGVVLIVLGTLGALGSVFAVVVIYCSTMRRKRPHESPSHSLWGGQEDDAENISLRQASNQLSSHPDPGMVASQSQGIERQTNTRGTISGHI